MKRFGIHKLVLKLTLFVLLAEAIAFVAIDAVHIRRDFRALGEDVEARLSLPGRLINTGVLEREAITDATALEHLIGQAPLAAFLAHPQTRRLDGIAMAVIAGDTEFEGFGFSDLRRRIANLFCDWRLFDQQDNDLVQHRMHKIRIVSQRLHAH